MGSVWKAAVLPVIAIAICHGIGIALFTGGFFLSRYELTNHSRCAQAPNFKFAAAASTGTADATPNSAAPNGDNHRRNGADGCWTRPQYDRAIILIVDALRFDFAYYNATAVPRPLGPGAAAGASSVPFYQNHLVSLHRALIDQPARARIFHFESDAPTVTMQRIKGLTTGSLPTFIDVKNNFESSAIDEDNWITQLADAGKRIVFMGDDTWEKLFPTRTRSRARMASGFARSYAFPSFNVKDLHTVDNGCIQHLLPTLKGEELTTTPASVNEEPLFDDSIERIHANRQSAAAAATAAGAAASTGSPPPTPTQRLNAGDWDVVISHFLGVDHVGHKFSAANVPAMQAKLDQIDAVIASVIQFIDSDWQRTSDERVVLFVLGDHGMTSDGNHGGQTTQETDTTLFVYSSAPIFEPTPITVPTDPTVASHRSHSGIPGRERVDARDVPRIPQIDFVSSLSLLLGVPIPYANLGAVIPELFLPFNADFPSAADRYRHLCTALHVNAGQVATYIAHYHTHAQPFPSDDYQRLVAAYTNAESTFHALEETWSSSSADASLERAYYNLATEYQSFLSIASAMCRSKWTMFDLDMMTGGLIVCAIGIAATAFNLFRVFRRSAAAAIAGSDSGAVFRAVCCAAVIAVYAQGLFTNSFIIHEHAVIMWLTAAVLTAVQLNSLRRRAGQSPAPVTPGWCMRLAAGSIAIRALALDWGSRYLPDLNLSSLAAAVLNRSVRRAAAVGDGDPLDAPAPAGGHHSDDGDDASDDGPASTGSADELYVLIAIAASLVLLPYLYARIAVSLVRRAETDPKPENGAAKPTRYVTDAPLACIALTSMASYILIVAYWCIPGVALTAAAGKTAAAGSAQAATDSLWQLLSRHRNWLPRTVYTTALCIVTVSVSSRRAVLPSLFALSSALGLVWLLLLGPKSALTASALILLTDSLLLCEPSIPLLSTTAVAASASASSASTVATSNISLPYTFADMLLLWLLSVLLFFATGKANAFNSLPITTAFVGFDEYQFASSGAMLLANTFVGQFSVLMCVVPIIVALRQRNRNQPLTWRVLAPAYITITGLYTFRALLSAANVTIQRRHLMVWAIFAPKFVFDAVSSLIVLLTSILWPILLSRFVRSDE